MIIVKVQGPTFICTMSILKTFLNLPISLKNYKLHVVYIVNADVQLLSEFKVPVT